MPKAEPYKLTDGQRPWLLVRPRGSKLWQLGYEAGGEQNTLSFGPFPEVSLAEARGKHDAACKLRRDGRDPGTTKPDALAAKQALDATTVEMVARNWSAIQEQWQPRQRIIAIQNFERWV